MLTIQDCEQYLLHASGGHISPYLTVRRLVHEAGQRLVNMRSWRFLEGPTRYYDEPGKISGVGTWTSSTNLFTAQTPGLFDDYRWFEGDTVDLSGYRYEVEGKVSNSVLKLTGNIGVDGDYSFSMDRSRIELPAHHSLISVKRRRSSFSKFILCDQTQIQEFRATGYGANPGYALYGAVTRCYGGDDPTTKSSVLEIWPPASQTRVAELLMQFRVGWITPSVDTEEIETISGAEWIEPLFLQVLRQTALGYEAGEVDDIAGRMTMLKASTEFRDAVLRDTAAQPQRGGITGGWLGNCRRGAQMDAAIVATFGGPTPIVDDPATDPGDPVDPIEYAYSLGAFLSNGTPATIDLDANAELPVYLAGGGTGLVSTTQVSTVPPLYELPLTLADSSAAAATVDTEVV